MPPVLSEISAATHPMPSGTDVGRYLPLLGADPFGFPRELAHWRQNQAWPQGSQWQAGRSHYYTDDFYNRIHLRPSRIDAGNLTEAISYGLELFNAYMVPVRVIDAVPVDAEGVTLSGLDLPAVIPALLSVSASVLVSLQGPAGIEARYVFSFDLAPDATLLVTGSRIVTFSLPPDWGEKVMEILSYSTQILEARSGAEQRIGLRAWPRWRLEYSALLGPECVNLLDSLLAGWGARSYALPSWPDKARLTQPVAQGDTVIACEAAGRGFEVGGLCCLWRDALWCETLEAAAVGDGQVTLRRPAAKAYGYGYLIPARLCRLHGKDSGISALASSLARADLAFEADAPWDGEAEDAPEKFEGISIFPYKHDFRKGRDRALSRSLDEYDTGLAGPSVRDRRGFPLDELEISDMMLASREEIARLKRWFAFQRGRAKSFWAVMEEDALRMSRRADWGSSMLYVSDNSYGLLESWMPNRRILAMDRYDGPRIIFRVNGFLPTEQGDTALFTDAAWPKDIYPDQVRRLAFLIRVRLDEDDLEIAREDDSMARVSFRLRGVLDS
jgi:hypothetical protein